MPENDLKKEHFLTMKIISKTIFLEFKRRKKMYPLSFSIEVGCNLKKNSLFNRLVLNPLRAGPCAFITLTPFLVSFYLQYYYFSKYWLSVFNSANKQVNLSF